MASYLGADTDPFNLNKGRFTGLERTETFNISQYVLFVTEGSIRYSEPFLAYYLNQESGARLAAASTPAIIESSTNRPALRIGARSDVSLHGAYNDKGLAAAYNAQHPENTALLAMTWAEINDIPLPYVVAEYGISAT